MPPSSFQTDILRVLGGKATSFFRFRFDDRLSSDIGAPVQSPTFMFAIEQPFSRLGAKIVQNQARTFLAPAARLIGSCKRRKFQFKVGDSTKQEETGGSLLTRVLVLRRLLRRQVLETNEQHVGILIPPSVGGTIVNLALAVDKRVAVNLNYTLSQELVNFCIRQAKLKHVLTTRKVMDKSGYDLDCEVVYLDDRKSVAEMRQALTDAQLPNLFVPSPDSFFRVDSLPLLGTGKIDLKGVRELARRATGVV